MTTMAAIDRVIHHSVILDMMTVESYRALEATQRQQVAQQKEVQPPAEMIGQGVLE